MISSSAFIVSSIVKSPSSVLVLRSLAKIFFLNRKIYAMTLTNVLMQLYLVKLTISFRSTTLSFCTVVVIVCNSCVFFSSCLASTVIISVIVTNFIIQKKRRTSKPNSTKKTYKIINRPRRFICWVFGTSHVKP